LGRCESPHPALRATFSRREKGRRFDVEYAVMTMTSSLHVARRFNV